MLLVLAVVGDDSFFFNGVAVRELVSFNPSLAAGSHCRSRSLAGAARVLTKGSAWAAFSGMGLLNNALPFVLIVCGQHQIASGLASILNATTFCLRCWWRIC